VRIAFLVRKFPALSETFILNQITGLLDRGHEVEIFAEADPKELKVHQDVTKYRLLERTHYLPANFWIRLLKALYLIACNFYKHPLGILRTLNIFKYRHHAGSLRLLYTFVALQNKKFDIIHCHYGPVGNLGAHLKQLGCPGKLVTTFHGFDISIYVTRKGPHVYDNLFAACDLCLPISQFWREKLIQLGCDAQKIRVHHMGIDLEKFHYAARQAKPRELLKILSVGRLTEKKGHQYAARAVAKVAAKYDNILWVIAGDGPLRSDIETLVSQLGIANFVNFLGAIEQNEVRNLYQQAHIFLLPSITASDGDMEGIPVVLMEAEAVGLPVVTTTHSGIPELVVHGKSGLLAAEKDVDSLAEKLQYLIEHPELWAEMGRAGREHVEKHYDIKKLNDKLVRIYQNLLGVH